MPDAIFHIGLQILAGTSGSGVRARGGSGCGGNVGYRQLGRGGEMCGNVCSLLDHNLLFKIKIGRHEQHVHQETVSSSWAHAKGPVLSWRPAEAAHGQ